MLTVFGGSSRLKKRRFTDLIVLLFVLLFAFPIGCSKEVSNQNGPSEKGSQPGEEIPSGDDTENSKESSLLQVTVDGNVKSPLVFDMSDFQEQAVTIKAEMRKCKETDPPREFTGIPLAVILDAAEPLTGSTKLTVVAADGYQKNYVLEDVLWHEIFIISEQEGTLQIIAENSQRYDASYWVRNVEKLIVQ